MRKRALLIVFEASDMQGKSYQAKRLVEKLNSVDITTAYAEPIRNSDAFFWFTRFALDNGLAKRCKNLFQTLQFLNRILFHVNALRELLQTHDVVVLDRWALSGLIYGNADGANKFLSKLLYKCLKKPDVTIVLHGEPYRSSRPLKDTYELDDAMQKRVNDGYVEWALKDVSACLVKSSGTKEHVHKRVMHLLRGSAIHLEHDKLVRLL
jgi:thymidylate kinase